jgi:hypothetical protein
MTADIYESPDGGETVYRRKPGNITRELHSQSPRTFDLHTQLMEDKLWGNIRRASKTDPALKEMLDQIKMYYTLKNSP